MVYSDDFNAIAKALAQQDRAQVLDDLNTERSGLSNGRMVRFLGAAATDAVNTRRRGKTGDGDGLDIALLPTMTFDELYDHAGDRLRNAESATERALVRAEENLLASSAALQTTLDRAATLEDGTRVFRDAEDQVWDEHHEMIDPDLVATVEWQGYEPAYETYVIRSDALTDDQDSIDAIRTYQVRLGEHREAWEDRDSQTRDSLETMLDQIEAEMPPEVLAESNAAATPSSESTFAFGHALPDLSH